MIETMKTGDRVLQQAEQLINDYNIAATAMIVYRRLNAENRLTKKQDIYFLELISKKTHSEEYDFEPLITLVEWFKSMGKIV